MALKEADHVGEVLFRIQPDGTWAAHQRRLYIVLKDGEIIHAKEGPAMALAAGDVADVIGEIVVGLTAERDRHRTAVRVAEEAAEDHRRERDAHAKALADAAQAHGEYAATMVAQVNELRSMLEKTTAERDAALAAGKADA